jgi:hypothetical protein
MPDAQKQLQSLPLCLIVSTWSNNQDSGYQCQSIHRALQQTGSRKYTPDMNFYAIATISIIQDCWITERGGESVIA